MQPAVTSNVDSASELPGISRSGKVLLACIAILALAGIAVSGISLQRHYARSATQFCDISQQFSCDIVNRSKYASIAGIPVAGIGVVGYGLLLVLSTSQRFRIETPSRLLGASLLGLGFAIYLTYIEAYVLTTWCILCLISLALISLISVLAGIVKFFGARA
ncbi:MAG TPA: vitamin K epoxide reductase family protein [Verrucomicrobiae bacterium]|nr:vitamin K epoxide reductase family protein [Verrucomicrobiae bacterium]